MKMSVLRLVIIIGFTILQTMLWVRLSETDFEKTIYFLISLTVCFFSGVGISYMEVEPKFIFIYLIFIFILNAATYFGYHTILRKHNLVFIKDPQYINNCKIDPFLDDKLLKVLTFLFYVTYLIFLVYPTFRINQLWNPPRSSSVLIFAKRSAASESLILKLSTTINNIVMPFFFVYLKKQLDDGKKMKTVLMILFWMYLDYLQFEYIGRYNIIVYLLFIYFLVAFVDKNKFIIVKRRLIILTVMILALVPFLVAYTYIRIGATFKESTYINLLRELIVGEISFPKQYRIIENFAGEYSSINFLLWILFLPIPSILFPHKPNMTVTQLFTYHVSGLVYGAQEFYSSNLPSLMGEGMIIWGVGGVWLHAIVVGFVIGFFMKLIRKYQSLMVLGVYQLVMLVALGRGGASSYLSTIINGSISILLYYKIATNRKIYLYKGDRLHD